LVIDSREQQALGFHRLPSTTGSLQSGDYSFRGGEELFVVERKSIARIAKGVKVHFSVMLVVSSAWLFGQPIKPGFADGSICYDVIRAGGRSRGGRLPIGCRQVRIVLECVGRIVRWPEQADECG
jgi:hypothetical protein